MDLISNITKKTDWESKINNSKIVAKWCKEFQQHKGEEGVFETVIKYLQTMRIPSHTSQEPSWRYSHNTQHQQEVQRVLDHISKKFTWPMFELSCFCGCAICGKSSLRYKNDPKNYDNWVYCLCQTEHPIALKEHQEELVKSFNDLIPNELRKLLLTVSKELECGAEWHPNTNRTVLDLIHPSTNSQYNELFRMFHWRPSEVEIVNGTWRFLTPINQIQQIDNPELYETIEGVLTLLMPKLLDCLNEFKNDIMSDIDSDSYKNSSSDSDKLYSGSDAEKENTDLQKTVNKPQKRYQIIVKMANTVLTPEKPKYKGGKWHLEGISSEQIVATGIYYYQMENITESGIRIRVPLIGEEYASDLDYEQNDFKRLPLHYRIEGNYTDGQDLGKIVTNENDTIIFPNFIQHKIESFELQEKSKSGSRKILLFWLIDPKHQLDPTCAYEPLLSRAEQIAHRDLLTFQRSNLGEMNENVFSTELNLCEH